jgi:GT2 family glycosyltransferase
MKEAEFEISVLIPTFGRMSVLKETLKRLSMQTYPKEKYEVIVIDDCSSDGTGDFLAKLELPFNFRYLLNRENLGRAKSRNIGIRAARGKYVLMIDDDIWAEPGLLEKHMEVHSCLAEEIAVTGAILVAPEIPQTTVNDFLSRRHIWCYEEMKKYKGALPYSFCKTASLSVKRDLLMRIGLFNESFSHYGGEDTELGYRLNKGGIKLYFAADAVGYHYHDETLECLVRKEIEKGMSMKTYLALVPESTKEGEGFFSPFYHRKLKLRFVIYNTVKVVAFSGLFRSLNTFFVRTFRGSDKLKPFMLRYMLPLLKNQYFRYGLKRAK